MPGGLPPGGYPAAAEHRGRPHHPATAGCHNRLLRLLNRAGGKQPWQASGACRGHGAPLGVLIGLALVLLAMIAAAGGWWFTHLSNPATPAGNSQRETGASPIELAPGLNPRQRPCRPNQPQTPRPAGHGLCRSKKPNVHCPPPQAKPAPAPSAAPANKRHSACHRHRRAPSPSQPARPPSLRRSPAYRQRLTRS